MPDMRREDYERGVQETIEEINQLHLSGAIKALGVVIIREDNDARTFIHHEKGGSFPLLAGCTILEHQMMDILKRDSR